MQHGEDPDPRSCAERFGTRTRGGLSFDGGAVRGVGPGGQALSSVSGPGGDGPQRKTLTNSITPIDKPHYPKPINQPKAELVMLPINNTEPPVEYATVAGLSTRLRMPFRELARRIGAAKIAPAYFVDGVPFFGPDALDSIERLVEQPEPEAPKRTRRKRAD